MIAEKQLFQDVLHSSRDQFNHAYLLHTLLLYGFALLGLAVALYYLFKKIAIPLFGLGAILLRSKWANYRSLILFISLTIIFLTLLAAKECRLRYMSFSPGSCFTGNDFTEQNPAISYRLLADSLGMNYFNQDSFHNHTDSTQFVVNRNGFPDWFDFDRAILDSMSKGGKTRKKKMLFLGDSFAEGVGASGFDKTFMEIYRRMNPQNIVCNTGIGGMDPIQYRLVADKFIPQIAPDEVVVLFCGWNDILSYERKAIPYLPVLTDIKNVGVIFNISPNGEVALPPDRAYRYYRNKFSLMETYTLAAAICRRSCVGTQAYYLINPVQTEKPTHATDSLASYRNLKKIKELSDAYGAKFTIIFIPTPEMAGLGQAGYEQRYAWAFKELWPYVKTCPEGTIHGGDCSTSIDYHFNDKGQKKFAAYLQGALVN